VNADALTLSWRYADVGAVDDESAIDITSKCVHVEEDLVHRCKYRK
jgi:hypothetical protein